MNTDEPGAADAATPLERVVPCAQRRSPSGSECVGRTLGMTLLHVSVSHFSVILPISENDRKMHGGKMEAQKLGVPVIDEAELLRLCAG
jgi:hypothetical protein